MLGLTEGIIKGKLIHFWLHFVLIDKPFTITSSFKKQKFDYKIFFSQAFYAQIELL